MIGRDFLTGLHCIEVDEDDHYTPGKKRYSMGHNYYEDEIIDRIDRARAKNAFIIFVQQRVQRLAAFRQSAWNDGLATGKEG